MRISSIYHYFFGLPNKDLEIIEKVKTQRHLVHKQINLSKVKLRPVITITKYGIYELDKNSLIKECVDINKIKFVDEFEKKKKRTLKKRKYR